MLDQYMKNLQEELEIEESFDTEVPGVWSIPLDEGITVMISTIPRGFSLSCTFGDFPEEKEGEFVNHAMLANLLGNGTDHAVLGLDEDGKKLRLIRDVEFSVDYNEFRDMIEDFMNSVDFWTEEAHSFVTEKT